MNKMNMLAVGLVALVATVAGCDDDESSPVAPAPSQTNLRAIHLSPDAPEVDIYFNGSATPAVTDLAFNEGTNFLTVNAGTYDIAIAPANTDVGSAALTVDDVDLDANTRYTAVAFAPVSSLDALLLTDDLSTPPAGQIRVRAIHTASAVGQVDIWNIPSGGGAPSLLYENVDFGVVGGYLTIPAGAYTLGFDVNNDANPDLTFTTPALAAGTVVNIFAVSEGSNVYLLAQLQNSQVAQINPN
jgi:hypothetical protein